jgi:hypothetical protein
MRRYDLFRIQLRDVLVLNPDVAPGEWTCLSRVDLDANLITVEELRDFTEILIDTDECVEEECIQRIDNTRRDGAARLLKMNREMIREVLIFRDRELEIAE